jgi:hypothetical protein
MASVATQQHPGMPHSAVCPASGTPLQLLADFYGEICNARNTTFLPAWQSIKQLQNLLCQELFKLL